MKEKFKKALPKRLLAFALTVAMAVTLLPVSGRVVKAEGSKTYGTGDNVDISELKPGDKLDGEVTISNNENYWFVYTNNEKRLYIVGDDATGEHQRAYAEKVFNKWNHDYEIGGLADGEPFFEEVSYSYEINGLYEVLGNPLNAGPITVVDSLGDMKDPTAKAHTDIYVTSGGLISQGGDALSIAGLEYDKEQGILNITGNLVTEELGSIFTSVDLEVIIHGNVALDTIEYFSMAKGGGSGVDIEITAGVNANLTLRGNPELVKLNKGIVDGVEGPYGKLSEFFFDVISDKAFFTELAPEEVGYFTTTMINIPIAVCNFDMKFAQNHYDTVAFPEDKTITISGFSSGKCSFNGMVASSGDLTITDSNINDPTLKVYTYTVQDEEFGDYEYTVVEPDPSMSQLSLAAINGNLIIDNSIVYPVFMMAGGVFPNGPYFPGGGLGDENNNKFIADDKTITIKDSYVESLETASTGTISVTGAGKAKSGQTFLNDENYDLGDANSYEYSFVNIEYLRTKDDLNIDNTKVLSSVAMAYNNIDVTGANGLLYGIGTGMMDASVIAGSFLKKPERNDVRKAPEPDMGTANITVDGGACIIAKGIIYASSEDNEILVDNRSTIIACGLTQMSMAGGITVDNGSVVELHTDKWGDGGDIGAFNLNVNNKSLVKTTYAETYGNLSLENSCLFIIGDGASIMGDFEISDDSQFVSVNDGYPAITVYGEAPDASKFRGTVDAIDGITLDNVIGSLYSQSSGYVSIDGSKADALGLYNAIEWYEDEGYYREMGGEKTSAIKVGEDFVNASTVIFYPGYSSGNYFPVNTPAATVTPEITVPVSGEGTTNVTAKVEGGNATVSVDTTAINNAAGNTTQDKTDTITVDLSGLAQPVTSITLSKADAANISNTLNSSANNKEYVEFQMKEYTVKIDSTAMAAVVNAAGGNDLKLVVETTAPAAVLNDNQKAELVGKEVARTFEAYFVSNGTRIGNFNGGSVQVGVVEFKVPAGNDARYYHVEYLPETGKAERYVTRYMNGYLYFETTHFSDYAIIYDETMVNGSMILVRRLFNKVTGEHLITTDEGEIAYNISTGKWSEDEPMGIAASEGTAVYRLFNKVSGEHLYTADANEVKHNTAGKVWVADNNGDPIFYAPASGKAVYRLFNIKLPGVACHINSADPTEISVLTNKGYVIENDGKPVFYLQ